MMRIVPTHLLCSVLAIGVAGISSYAFSQDYGNGTLPPIIMPQHLETGQPKQRILPPIISPERKQSRSTSAMLKPLQPNDVGEYQDSALQPVQSVVDAAQSAVSRAGIPLYSHDSVIRKDQSLTQWKIDSASEVPAQPSSNKTTYPNKTTYRQTVSPAGGIPPITQGSGSRAIQPAIQGSGSRSIQPFAQGSGSRSIQPFPQGSDSRSLLPSVNPGVQQDSFAPGVAGAPQSVINNETAPFLPTESSVGPAPVQPQSGFFNGPPAGPGFGGQQLNPGFANQGIVPGTSNYFDHGQTPANFQSGGAPTNNNGCQSCGPGGCYDPNAVQNQFGCSGSVASADYYFWGDILLWTRSDGDIQLSNFSSLSDFSWEAGFRATLGYRQNATLGREFTYFGTGDLEESETVTSQSNNLGSLFVPAGGFGAAETTAFFNANEQTQSKESKIHSLEYNRVRWGWDVLKQFVGIRYLYFGDEVELLSTSTVDGRFAMNNINNLIGAHVGGELFYDVGFRSSVSLTGKTGAYLNFADVDTTFVNDGNTFIDRDVDDTHLASSIELGIMGHYQLNPRARFRLGYDVLLLWGLFTVENNAPRLSNDPFLIPPPNILTPLTGSDLNTNNDTVVFHGLSFGLEIFR